MPEAWFPRIYALGNQVYRGNLPPSRSRRKLSKLPTIHSHQRSIILGVRSVGTERSLNDL